MSIFKRLSATLVSHIDQVVGEIENHDAVVQATLQDMSKRLAEAKVRLNRVHRERTRLQQQIQQQQADAQHWRERAVACAEADEDKALECVRRSRDCRRRAEKLEQLLTEYESTAEKLAVDIDTSEQRLAQGRQKHRLMQARESTSSALNATTEGDGYTCQALEDAFDRWEINVTQAEMVCDADLVRDPLEQEFTNREQQEALRCELAALLEGEEKR